jgi:hypothetical protein
MNKEQSQEILTYVVQTTEPRWRMYQEHWSNLDEVFMRRGFEQGGFQFWKFFELLKHDGIGTISIIGSLLPESLSTAKYEREIAGGLQSLYYLDLQKGNYGENGIKFYQCARDYLEKRKGSPGQFYWLTLWGFLRSCPYLTQYWNGSFTSFLKAQYAKFCGKPSPSDEEFFNIDSEKWEQFKAKTKPWKPLNRIGMNVFDFILGDVAELKFVQNAFKLDSANEYFFGVTGLKQLICPFTRENIIEFLHSLNLPYTVRQINTGIYTYCSETEAQNFGFCRHREKCQRCRVNHLCLQNIP